MYADLWKATCAHNTDIQFVAQKIRPFSSFVSADKGAKWLTDALIGKFSASPYLSNPASYGGSCYIEGKNRKKAILNQSEYIALFQMLQKQKEQMDKACEQYFSKNEDESEKGTALLVKMAGQSAVTALDQALWKNPLSPGKPAPDG